KNNFCYDNYLQGQCVAGGGQFSTQTCANVAMCSATINELDVLTIGTPFLEHYSMQQREQNTIGIKMNPFIQPKEVWVMYSINNNVQQLPLYKQENAMYSSLYSNTLNITTNNNEIITFFYG